MGSQIRDGAAAMATPTISSPGGSPKDRLKFLCSHSGRILPRPPHRHLKYVGGETRLVSVPRDVSFQDLMNKLAYMIDGGMLLKYQVAPEDLDALVSVKSDEDLRHMRNEIDGCEIAGTPRLRAFLFPANPVVMENQISCLEPNALEQWYIDAVNGIIRLPPYAIKQHPTVNAVQQSSYVSSACSSPSSADSCEAMKSDALLPSNYYNSRFMHKVRSSPSLCGNLNVPQQSGSHVHPLSRRSVHQYSLDPQRSVAAPERLISAASVGWGEGVRYQVESSPTNYNVTSRQNPGNGFCTKCMLYDDCNHLLGTRKCYMAGSLSMIC